MNDNLNNKEEFDFRKEFENQKKELAHAQRITQSYHSTELPADGGNSYKRKGFRIKFIHIILLAVVVVGGVFFYNYYTVNKEELYEKKANLEMLYDKNNYIKFRDNNLYGYIDHDGNIKIEAKYSSAGNFYNGYAIVQTGDKKEIINVNGQHMHDIKSDKDGYNINYDYWIVDGTLYSGQMIKVHDDVKKIGNNDKYFYYYDRELNKTTIIDYVGNNIYSFDERNINFDIKTGFHVDELIFVNYGNKYLIINPDSKKIIYEGDDSFTLLDNGIYKQDRYYFIFDDETIYPYTAVNVSLIDKENKILKIEEAKNVIYYYDLVNNKKIDTYEMKNLDIVASQFNYDIVHCDKDNNLYSLVKDGSTLLDCKYEKIEFLNDGLHEYIRKKNGFEYVFAQNVELSIVHNLRLNMNPIEEDYVDISYVDGSPFVIYTPKKDNNDETQITVYNLVDSSKRKYPKNDYVYFDSGYNYYVFYNMRTEKLEYFNANMKSVFSISYDIRENGINGVFFEDESDDIENIISDDEMLDDNVLNK